MPADIRPFAVGAGRIVVVALSAAASGAAVGVAWTAIAGQDMVLWLVARSAGISSYVLLTLVTALGILLSHPARARWRWPSTITRIRLHVVLTVFALALVVLHIVVLAIDPWAKVGWAGALLPMGAAYRPLPVTLGLISLWAGLISGVTASLSGRVTGRIWLPLHRLAAAAWVLAWAHGVLAGSDTPALLWMYVGTAGLVVALAAWRYAARTAADQLDELRSRTRPGVLGPQDRRPREVRR